MKKFSDYTDRDRIINIEEFIFWGFISFGCYLFIIIKPINDVFVILVVGTIALICLSIATTKLIMINYFLTMLWSRSLQIFYEGNKPLVDNFSYFAVIAIGTFYLFIHYSLNISAVIAIIVAGIVGNLISNRFFPNKLK